MESIAEDDKPKRARIVPVKKQPFKSKITLLIMGSLVDTDLEAKVDVPAEGLQKL
jgi:transcription termination factor Rho